MVFIALSPAHSYLNTILFHSMSLKNNVLEQLKTIIESKKLSKTQFWKLVADVRKEIFMEVKKKLVDPRIKWNDDQPNAEEFARYCAASRSNASLMIDNIADNLAVIKILLLFWGEKGLKTKEKRIELLMVMPPSTKEFLEKILDKIKFVSEN